MPRAIVTPELAETLRGIRLQNKIQAKSLAAYIGKSPAFISKLESGNIQTIDTKELYSILQLFLERIVLLSWQNRYTHHSDLSIRQKKLKSNYGLPTMIR